MIHVGLRLAQAVAALGTLAGIGYYCLSIWSALKYLRDRSRQSQSSSFRPPVSILKPLKGADPHMYEAFRSHCVQDYPEYEIIFGVSEADDPAIALVEQLKAEFPRGNVRLLICSNILGTNVKVSNLVHLARAAQHDYLVVNDSDIRVAPDYLQRVMAPLADENVGLVTALYRGLPAASLGSRLEALGISTDFCAGVLSAQVVEGGMRFGLGSTMAFRARDLQKIGGFEPLLDYLGDDYELGARIAATGLRIQLADFAVETFLPKYSLRGFFSHQLRWARTVRDARPWGYFGLSLTFGIPWAILAAALTGGALPAWLLVALTVVARTAMALVVGRRVLRDDHLLSLLWLLPLRDIIFVFVWIVSYLGHRIHWRGTDFYLRSGKLVRLQ